jgi:hypothetical protein
MISSQKWRACACGRRARRARVRPPFDLLSRPAELHIVLLCIVAVGAHVDHHSAAAAAAVVLDDRVLALPAHAAEATQVVIRDGAAARTPLDLLRRCALGSREAADAIEGHVPRFAAAGAARVDDPREVLLPVLTHRWRDEVHEDRRVGRRLRLRLWRRRHCGRLLCTDYSCTRVAIVVPLRRIASRGC